MRHLLLLGEPEPEEPVSARRLLREFIDDVLAEGKPTDAALLIARAQAELAGRAAFAPVAARQYVSEWVPRLLREGAHRTRTPRVARPGLSEEARGRAVQRWWAGYRVTVGEGRTNVLDEVCRPELTRDADRRQEQIEADARFVAFERGIADLAPDDRTPVKRFVTKPQRVELYDTYFGRSDDDHDDQD